MALICMPPDTNHYSDACAHMELQSAAAAADLAELEALIEDDDEDVGNGTRGSEVTRSKLWQIEIDRLLVETAVKAVDPALFSCLESVCDTNVERLSAHSHFASSI
jgi:hypothetical protein